jgi:magnesium-dependent phosphatase 1
MSQNTKQQLELLKELWLDDTVLKPKLLVFDLDYTVWPCYIEMYDEPFERFTKHLQDKRVHVRDRCKKEITCFEDIDELLKFLYEQSLNGKLKLAVASRSTGRKAAMDYLKLLGYDKYFSSIQIYPGNKTRHIKKICEEIGHRNFNEIIFYDDDVENMYNTKHLGIHTCLLNPKNGLNLACFIKSLKDFNKN